MFHQKPKCSHMSLRASVRLTYLTSLLINQCCSVE